MIIKNLHFFDNNGYSLNLKYIDNVWTGDLFFNETSVDLNEVLHIFILEKVVKNNVINYVYPRYTTKAQLNVKLSENSNTDFYVFSIDKTDEVPTITKSNEEIYSLDDGTLDNINSDGLRIVNNLRKDALQINIGYSPTDESISDGMITIMNDDILVAQINIRGEAIGNDERLNELLVSLYDKRIQISDKESFIYRNVDVNEQLPNYIILNDKRKELLLEAHNIFPYIGSEKALVNILNHFGYPDIDINNYWKNIDPESRDFNKYKKFLIPFQASLQGEKKVRLPREVWQRTNLFSLAYPINQKTDQFDEDDLPIVEDTFKFTVDEILIKLFGLLNYLEKNFLPLNVKIVEIIGETVRPEKYGFNTFSERTTIDVINLNRDIEFVADKTVGYLEDLRKTNPVPNNVDTVSPISEYKDVTIANQRALSTLPDSPNIEIGMPVNLSVTSFDLKISEINGTIEENGSFTANNIGYGLIYELKWIIRSSDNLFVESKFGKVEDFRNVTFILPKIGVYDVELILYDTNNTITNKYKKNYIEVISKNVEFVSIYRMQKYPFTIDSIDGTIGDNLGTVGYPSSTNTKISDCQTSFNSLNTYNYQFDTSTLFNNFFTILDIDKSEEYIDVELNSVVKIGDFITFRNNEEINPIIKASQINSKTSNSITMDYINPEYQIKGERVSIYDIIDFVDNTYYHLYYDSTTNTLNIEQTINNFIQPFRINNNGDILFNGNQINQLNIPKIYLKSFYSSGVYEIIDLVYDPTLNVTILSTGVDMFYEINNNNIEVYIDFIDFTNEPSFDSIIHIYRNSTNFEMMVIDDIVDWYMDGNILRKEYSTNISEFTSFNPSNIKYETNYLVLDIESVNVLNNEIEFTFEDNPNLSNITTGNNGSRIDIGFMRGMQSFEIINKIDTNTTSRLYLNDEGTRLLNVTTTFKAYYANYNIEEALKRLDFTNINANNFSNVKVGEISKQSFQTLKFTPPYRHYYEISNVFPLGIINIEGDIFQFSGDPTLDLTKGAIELNNSDVTNISKFQYYTYPSNNPTKIIGVAKSKNNQNLFKIDFFNGVLGTDITRINETTTLPIHRFVELNKDINIKSTNNPPNWNLLYQYWEYNNFEYPVDPFEKYKYSYITSGDFNYLDTNISLSEFEIPPLTTVFFNFDNCQIVGKTSCLWKLYDSNNNLLYETDMFRWAWTFDVIDNYNIELTIIDSNNNVYNSFKNGYIKVRL